MDLKRFLQTSSFAVSFAFCGVGPAFASPWAEVGDAQLRSDIELLANAGLIDGITTQWPLPWSGVSTSLDGDNLGNAPDYIRQAAQRVRNAALAGTQPHTLKAGMAMDLSSAPDVVRGFDAMGRETAQGQLLLEYDSYSTSFRLAVGMQTASRYDRQAFVPDNSFIAQRVGNAIVYAGYQSHWWGPGWISALSLSNNARPFPQVGISRIDTSPFDLPVLRWLGPWQAEMFVGVLDGNRTNRNTIYDGVRVTINPFPGFELGIARTDEMCGIGHPCEPLAEWLHFSNNVQQVNQTNDEGLIDVRYSNRIGGLPFSIYAQEMNEVESNPLPQSVSHLYGGTVWFPVAGRMLRLTLEYANSVPTYQLFGGSDDYGLAYNNVGYPDGMRYRDRSLGFSLDSDSKLLTLQAGWTDSGSRAYTLAFHHASVSDSEIASGEASFYNAVTASPVTFNIAEARVTIPWRSLKVDLKLHAQDDQPRPAHGFTAGAEIAVAAAL